jgi:membrane-bound serine protease (ClpP class)
MLILIGHLRLAKYRRTVPRLIPRFFRSRTLLILLCLSLFLIVVGGFLSVSATSSATATVQSDTTGVVLVADFSVPVDPGSAAFMSRVVTTAQSQHAAAIVIKMNTPGGLLSDMISIVGSITTANQSGIPTYTFIVPNGLGASAGSYIAMATNQILMAPGSEIGPSTPIVVGGSALEQNHTQAAMLDYMTSLAERWGRNSTAVYDMVQYDQAYSATEAVAVHVADGNTDSLSTALNQLGLSSNPQEKISESLYEQVISALSNSILDGILILLGVVAIVLDIYHPTIVLTVVGVIAIVAGLIGAEVIDASALGLVILVLSAALIIVELKLGHGFALIAGVILGAFGIYYLSFGLQYSPSPITGLVEIELSVLVVFGILIGLYIRWIVGPLRRRRKLTGSETMLGKTGIALTDLTPKGEVRVLGEIWRAESSSGNIQKNEEVTVKALKGLVVIVEKTPSSQEKNDEALPA